MTLPIVGLIFPAIMLNNVVFPAPLGPMRPVIFPVSICMLALSTALMPPKFTETSFIFNIFLPVRNMIEIQSK